MTSQHGQDAYVLQLLGHKRSGFFLDSGASNGVRCSNTRLLEESYGWTGICVEPDISFFAELVRNRSCVCVNCCLYDVDGTVEFVAAGTVGGIPQELTPALLPYVRGTLGLPDGARLPSERVPCRLVGSLLKECGAPPVIDYWSLDTEGSELTILRGFPFGQYAVRVLSVEHNWEPSRAKIHDFLRGQGYLWAAEMACDDVYVHPTIFGARAWRSRARKRWTGSPVN